MTSWILAAWLLVAAVLAGFWVFVKVFNWLLDVLFSLILPPEKERS